MFPNCIFFLFQTPKMISVRRTQLFVESADPNICACSASNLLSIWHHTVKKKSKIEKMKLLPPNIATKVSISLHHVHFKCSCVAGCFFSLFLSIHLNRKSSTYADNLYCLFINSCLFFSLSHSVHLHIMYS